MLEEQLRRDGFGNEFFAERKALEDGVVGFLQPALLECGGCGGGGLERCVNYGVAKIIGSRSGGFCDSSELFEARCEIGYSAEG